MVIVAFIGMVVFVISYVGVKEFWKFREATERCILCEAAAKDLQDGSHYLTEKARLYALTGEKEYMLAYFTETDVTRRREKALEQLGESFDGTQAFDSLESAMNYSLNLMKTEYYAMRLVAEAAELDSGQWPEEIREAALSQTDQALSADDKIRLAQRMLSDDSYQDARENIDGKVTECMRALMDMAKAQQTRASNVFSDLYVKQEIGVVLLIVMVLAAGVIIRRLIVAPLLRYNENIRRGETLNVEGAAELQVLAETYNRFYKENQKVQRLIRHRAEHDSLTDLLNRGSFDRILKDCEENRSSFALIIIDVDCFKSINDTSGHAEGDEVLKSVAALLINAFRSCDYVFRIGGDEFAVIMMDVGGGARAVIRDKIDEINQAFASSEIGLPHISISAGAAFFDGKEPEGHIFEDADYALYQCKFTGKSGCSFYSDVQHDITGKAQ